MDVISRPEPRFRVNATRIAKLETPKNYGSVDEFVTVLRATPVFAICQAGLRPVSPYEIRNARGRAAGMAARIFCPCSQAIALRPCCPRQQTRPAFRTGSSEEIQCARSS